jgi:type II secretory ATPase GspE/PulE/Tfp pilus assembly ATPase PilB-like protein
MLVLAATKDASDFVAVDTIISLQLVPRLCDMCKEKYQLSRQESDALEEVVNFAKVLAALRDEEIVDKQLPWKDLQFYIARGCHECTRGYKGVLGLQEVSNPSRGGFNLIEDGLYKAAQGLTSIEAILSLI